MSLLSAHIPFLFGAVGSLMMLISMSAVTITGYKYLRAMEASQARIRAEQSRAPHTPPRY